MLVVQVAQGTLEAADSPEATSGPSIRDPNNELIYLYEIRDALSRKFGNSDKAISVLDIPKTKWKDFGKLCNYEPLKQGRHRGQHAALRNATDIELSEARETAKTIIEA